MKIKKKKLCRGCQKPIKKKLKNKKLIGISKFCSLRCYFNQHNLHSGKALATLTSFTKFKKGNSYQLGIDFGQSFSKLVVNKIDKKNGTIVFSPVKQIKKNKPERDKEYLIFLSTLFCSVCGIIFEKSEAAHTEYHGLGIKGSDLSCISLCAECHRGSKGLDSIGREKFEKYHKVNIDKLNIKCLRLYIKYLKEKK